MLTCCSFAYKLIPAIAVACCMVITTACQEPSASVSNSSGSNTTSGTDSGSKSDFDAARAYSHVKKLVEIGPRPPGSEAIKKSQEYIMGELKSYGLKVTEDRFEGDTTRGAIPMVNLIAELPGKKPDLV